MSESTQIPASGVLKDRAFFAAQRRVRDAKRELKEAEEALWALLGEKPQESK